MKQKSILSILSIVIVLLLALYAAAPLFHPQLFTAHDIWHQVARLYHYTQTSQAGFFPPAWVASLAHGYGYPLFIFSYHIPWLFAIPLAMIGLSTFDILRVLFIAGWLFSGLSMYWLLSAFTAHRLSRIVGATLYVWAPYHFLSVYVAAAIGTAYIFVFVPLMFLGVWYLVQDKKILGTILLSLSTAATILAHLMTFAMVLPLLLMWILMIVIGQKKRIEKLFWIGVAFLLGLLAASYYLLPSLVYLSSIIASDGAGLSNNFPHYFASFKQLLYSPWGFGPIISNAKDGEISLQVGVAQWLGVLAGVIALGILWMKSTKSKKAVWKSEKIVLLITFTILFVISILLMMDLTLPLWNFAASLAAVDFPFRLLLMAVFSGSVLAGLAIDAVRRPWLRLLIALIFILLALYTNRNHRRVNLYTDYALSDYIGAEITTNTYSEYLPKTANAALLNQDQPEAIDQTSYSLEETINNNQLTSHVIVQAPATVTLHHFAFPGIETTLNQVKLDSGVDKSGLITVDLEPGEYTLTTTYHGTTLVHLSRFASIVALSIIGFLMWQLKSKKKKAEK